MLRGYLELFLWPIKGLVGVVFMACLELFLWLVKGLFGAIFIAC